MREYKFDVGDWIAQQDSVRGWILAGKVIDADSDSVRVQRRDGTAQVFVVGEDPIARVKWSGHPRRTWSLA